MMRAAILAALALAIVLWIASGHAASAAHHHAWFGFWFLFDTMRVAWRGPIR